MTLDTFRAEFCKIYRRYYVQVTEVLKKVEDLSKREVLNTTSMVDTAVSMVESEAIVRVYKQVLEDFRSLYTLLMSVEATTNNFDMRCYKVLAEIMACQADTWRRVAENREDRNRQLMMEIQRMRHDRKSQSVVATH